MISSNFLTEIFPCRFQKLLSSNNYIKHIFGYLTLVFFVSLNVNNINTNLWDLFHNSFYLYLGFMILPKTNIIFFITILILLGLLYVIHLKKTIELQKNDEGSKQNIKQLDKYSYYIQVKIIILLSFGFIIYLGEKKYEYGNEFKYNNFLIGKPNCINKTPNIPIDKAFFKAFT